MGGDKAQDALPSSSEVLTELQLIYEQGARIGQNFRGSGDVGGGCEYLAMLVCRSPSQL